METVLAPYVLRDPVYLVHVHEGALHTLHIHTCIIQHIAFSYKLLCPRLVQNRSGIHPGDYPESYACREVGLD